MSFFHQILAETRKLLRSGHIVVLGVLIVVLINIVVPTVVILLDNQPLHFITNFDSNMNYYLEGEPLIVNGVEFKKNNLITYHMATLYGEIQIAERRFAENERIYALEMLNGELEFLAQYANLFDNDGDYRSSTVMYVGSLIKYKCLLELTNPDFEAIKEIASVTSVALGESNLNILPISFDFEYFKNLTLEEKENIINMIEQDIADLKVLIEENDFTSYGNIMLRLDEYKLQSREVEIERQEAYLAENPYNKEFVLHNIEMLKQFEKQQEEWTIPVLEYRLQHNIAYDDGSWQDLALEKMSQSYYSRDNTYMSEENFNYSKQHGTVFVYPDSPENFRTYDDYVYAHEQEQLKYEYQYYIAETSLENGKPDMSVMPNGARQKLYSTFNAYYLMTLFALLVGGTVMAAEYQSGTLRLLMIRPRVRSKVLASAYLGGLLLIFGLFFAVNLIGFVSHGAIYGFGDYLNPNYTISGEVPFFGMLFGDLFAMFSLSVLIYTFAFSCSIFFKNVAVSMILPLFVLVGSTMLMQYLVVNFPITAINFTPIPYLSLHKFTLTVNEFTADLQNNSLTYIPPLGVIVNLFYSGVLMLIASQIFIKKDV